VDGAAPQRLVEFRDIPILFCVTPCASHLNARASSHNKQSDSRCGNAPAPSKVRN
jgi:hypothetical protein